MSSHLYQSPSSSSTYQTSLNDRAVSPTRSKITQLSEKLSNLQLQVDDEKSLKKEVFESKLKTLDEKFTKSNQNDSGKFKVLTEQITKLEEGVQNEKIYREGSDEQFRTRDIKSIEQSLQKELHRDRQLRKESEAKLLKHADEKIYQFRFEIFFEILNALQIGFGQSQEIKRRDRGAFRLGIRGQGADPLGRSGVGKKKSVMHRKQKIFDFREEQNQLLIKRLGESILGLQETLTRERRQREEAQSQMFRMLDDMNNFLNHQLHDEKQNREANEEMLIRLLDETCTRVESHLRK